MSAAAKRTVLLAVSVVVLGAVSVAGSAGGATWKRDRLPPTAPTNLHVEAATPTWVLTGWDPSQDNVAVAGYQVYTETGRATVASPRYMVGDLACGQSTSVAVVAFDRAGNRSARVPATVATAACPDNRPPSTPSGFRQVVTAQNAVVLAWNPSGDDTGVVGYGVYRNVVQIAAPTEPTVTLSGLTCGSTYTYGVDAVDAAGNRSLLGTAYVQTASCSDGNPPAPPADLAVTGRTQTSISISWSASSDDVGVAGYRVRVDGVTKYNGAQTSATLSDLACGMTYAIGVTAFDAAGNQSTGSTTSAATTACSAPPPPPSGDTTPPSTPTNQTVSGATGTSFVMSWSPATDNVAVTGYSVYLDGVMLATVAATSYTYTGLACGTTYTVALVARDAAGNVSNRAEATGPASTLACSAPPPPPPPPPSGDTTPPSQPSSLAVSGATRTSVSLTWAAASDNVGVTGYGTYVNGSARSSSSQPGATVSNLSCGTAYTLEVDAYDAAGNRSGRASLIASTAVCADTQAPTAPTNVVATSRTATSIAVSWSASSDNVGIAGYGLYRGGVQTGTSASAPGVFSGLACNTNYTLAVDAVDAAGNRSAPTVVMVSTTACPDTQPPSVPQGQRITASTQSTIAMAWNAATDNVGVAGYEVWLDDVKMTTTTGLSHTYGALACGTSHTVGLVAYDAAGNRSDRALASGPASTTACSAPPPSPPPPPPPPPPSGGIQPGQSWQAAYDGAPAGSTLAVAAGSHGTQTLTGSKAVTFRGVDGAVLSALVNNASNVTLDNVDIDGNASNVTILKNEGSGNTYRNLEVRDNTDVQMVGNYGSFGTYDNVVFHDAVMTTAGENAGVHMECMWSNGPNLTVRNSVFRDCSVMDLFLTRGSWWGQGNVCCVTLENNIFWPSERTNNTGVHFYSVQVHDNADSIDRYQVRNNRLDLPFNLGDNPVVNSAFCGNSGQVAASWTAGC